MKLKIELPVLTTSLNDYLRMHFTTRTKLRLEYEWELVIINAHDKKYKALNKEKRKLTITSYRKYLIKDTDNFIGGLKPLIDALVNLKLIHDDSYEYCEHGEHRQLPLGISDGEQRTEILIEDI